MLFTLAIGLNVAAQLTVPDMSSLAALMPAREAFYLVGAGQRTMIAVPDPSRNSLTVSSDTGGPLTLSTIADGTATQGIMFNAGIQPPYLITWDLYGALLHNAWYAHNPGATGRNVTVMEVMTRPQNNPDNQSGKERLQPLKTCLKRFQPPIFSPPPIDSGGSGVDCDNAIGFNQGQSQSGSIAAGGSDVWYTITLLPGNYTFSLTTFVDPGSFSRVKLYTGNCSGLTEIFSLGSAGQNVPITGSIKVKVDQVGASALQYAFVVN